MRIPLFRIWYSTTYTTLFLILLLILAITPADMIYQSIRTNKLRQIFVIGGVYLLTFFIVLLIYSTRIYTNRTVLAAIPKGFLPIEEGEVGRGVRRMVVKALARSAVVAWDSRPRDLRIEQEEEGGDEEDASRPNTAESKKGKAHKKKKSEHHGIQATVLPVTAQNPPWGHVAHPGWASPSSSDLPNLQYWSVICELPNLIEAKAVSLAPPDPALEEQGLQYPDNAPPLPDAQIVTLLQRPRAMGLREYLARLSDFGLLHPLTLGQKFLGQYEYARFSTASLTEEEFRSIMSVFADILNGMTELDPAVIEEVRAQSIASFDNHSLAPTASDSNTTSSNSSQIHRPYRTPTLDRQRSVSSYSENASSHGDGTHSPHTARTAPEERSPRLFDMPRTPSLRSQSETGSVLIHDAVARSPSTILPNSSASSSLRSAQSVIRLHPDPSEGDLPYQYAIDRG